MAPSQLSERELGTAENVTYHGVDDITRQAASELGVAPDFLDNFITLLFKSKIYTEIIDGEEVPIRRYDGGSHINHCDFQILR